MFECNLKKRILNKKENLKDNLVNLEFICQNSLSYVHILYTVNSSIGVLSKSLERQSIRY